MGHPVHWCDLAESNGCNDNDGNNPPIQIVSACTSHWCSSLSVSSCWQLRSEPVKSTACDQVNLGWSYRRMGLDLPPSAQRRPLVHVAEIDLVAGGAFHRLRPQLPAGRHAQGAVLSRGRCGQRLFVWEGCFCHCHCSHSSPPSL